MKFFDNAPQRERLRDKVLAALARIVDSDQYIGTANNPAIERLESRLGSYVGVKHAVTCADGTDAIELALNALQIPKGSEVITTAFSYFATAGAIQNAGYKPVFVDIDPKTYNIDPAKIAEKITPETSAIVAVSLFGQCADFDAINAIAAKHGLPVIEDGAQSFGATYKGRKSLSLTTIGCTSFYPTKPLGCYGDGGAIFTNDDAIAQRIRVMKNQGQGQESHVHIAIGRNSRLDAMQAAILLVKMEELEKDLADRGRIARIYSKAFQQYPGMAPHVAEGNQSVFAQYCIQVPNRDGVRRFLEKDGIPTELEGVQGEKIPTMVYYPLSLPYQPAMVDIYGNPGRGRFPVAEATAGNILALPFYPGLQAQDQQKVIAEVSSAVERLKGLKFSSATWAKS